MTTRRSAKVVELFPAELPYPPASEHGSGLRRCPEVDEVVELDMLDLVLAEKPERAPSLPPPPPPPRRRRPSVPDALLADSTLHFRTDSYPPPDRIDFDSLLRLPGLSERPLGPSFSLLPAPPPPPVSSRLLARAILIVAGATFGGLFAYLLVS
jgi:hypothetical protein